MDQGFRRANTRSGRGVFGALSGSRGASAHRGSSAGRRNRRQGYRWIKASGGQIPVPAAASSGRYLGQEERLRIADLRLGGAGVRAIAWDLGRSASTRLSSITMCSRWFRDCSITRLSILSTTTTRPSPSVTGKSRSSGAKSCRPRRLVWAFSAVRRVLSSAVSAYSSRNTQVSSERIRCNWRRSVTSVLRVESLIISSSPVRNSRRPTT
ncbi:helix-turn-helix domain-containing protein [Cryobacterium sp. TMT1-19]|uniref:helix-turn-helix domain-containing protein n=1 Tax=Cryobacterium sp. TMT1-19 TaxID=1259231 RepID=UPI00141AE63C